MSEKSAKSATETTPTTHFVYSSYYNLRRRKLPQTTDVRLEASPTFFGGGATLRLTTPRGKTVVYVLSSSSVVKIRRAAEESQRIEDERENRKTTEGA